jgi:hypothetical protein
MRALSLIAIAGCSFTPSPEPTGAASPRGLRADQHLERAEDQSELARDRSVWPTPTTMTPGETDIMPRIVPGPLRPSVQHEDAARVHRGAAAGLYAAYQAACGDRPAAEVSVSPLERFQIGGYKTERGVIVLLDRKAGRAREVVSRVECYRAWLMLETREREDPLDIPDLHVDARDDREGVTVSLTPADPEWIPELQRRVTVQLEARARTARDRRGGPQPSAIP